MFKKIRAHLGVNNVFHSENILNTKKTSQVQEKTLAVGNAVLERLAQGEDPSQIKQKVVCGALKGGGQALGRSSKERTDFSSLGSSVVKGSLNGALETLEPSDGHQKIRLVVALVVLSTLGLTQGAYLGGELGAAIGGEENGRVVGSVLGMTLVASAIWEIVKWKLPVLSKSKDF